MKAITRKCAFYKKIIEVAYTPVTGTYQFMSHRKIGGRRSFHLLTLLQPLKCFAERYKRFRRKIIHPIANTSICIMQHMRDHRLSLPYV